MGGSDYLSQHLFIQPLEVSAYCVPRTILGRGAGGVAGLGVQVFRQNSFKD